MFLRVRRASRRHLADAVQDTDDLRDLARIGRESVAPFGENGRGAPEGFVIRYGSGRRRAALHLVGDLDGELVHEVDGQADVRLPGLDELPRMRSFVHLGAYRISFRRNAHETNDDLVAQPVESIIRTSWSFTAEMLVFIRRAMSSFRFPSAMYWMSATCFGASATSATSCPFPFATRRASPIGLALPGAGCTRRARTGSHRCSHYAL